ncbi:hypothetical protein BPLS_P3679 [Bathymodiolus platifrons methanotrophic gill symbiont]|nr:hypothetical protein [Bathymodiolus platifrons methanotrophic gill symbiont]TXL10454.1 hypothetical protein BMR04_16385 [Methylococcaceae bacterium HT3]TXL14078.1 hypothetical protein BMR05_09010 [Methylococcaceae bacterium HT4]TXL20744.1 hypothetical protein BMR06_03660 [Methylococcaceae bacterium HT5]TXL22907.1 hypothetical protein BMR03_05240 [Methylococcaceae bacterium HT2]GFO76090.1 hypothetical protein BPLS_P3679 [Bathymodiolus platifrons methanotrophic gill symbiont]
MTNLTANNFWNTDLEDVEAVFLPKGMKITDLPVTLDERIPTQGSVILDKTININDEVKTPSLIQKFMYFMFK